MADVGPNMHRIPMTAMANIKPAHVVKLSPLSDMAVEQANANDIPFGIAQEFTQWAPGTPYDDSYAATEGSAILVYGPCSIAVAALKANAGAIPPGESVGANAGGEITVTSTGWAVGWVLESGDATKSQRLRLFVFPHKLAGGS